MSKYIIDLRPDCKVVQQICVSDDNVGVGARSVGLLDALTDDYIKENFKYLLDAEYQRGFEDGNAVNDKGCEGCKYKGTIGMPPCIHCCNNFPNAWKKQDDKPIIGEVVERYLNGKLDSTGIYLGEDGDYWNCLFWTGAVFGTFAYPKNQFKKTEKHVDIASILEAMKHD